jgi:hypothetical protein
MPQRKQRQAAVTPVTPVTSAAPVTGIVSSVRGRTEGTPVIGEGMGTPKTTSNPNNLPRGRTDNPVLGDGMGTGTTYQPGTGGVGAKPMGAIDRYKIAEQIKQARAQAAEVRIGMAYANGNVWNQSGEQPQQPQQPGQTPRTEPVPASPGRQIRPQY